MYLPERQRDRIAELIGIDGRPPQTQSPLARLTACEAVRQLERLAREAADSERWRHCAI